VIRLICIGRLKEKHYEDASNEYLKRIERYSKIEVSEIKEQTDRNIDVAKKKEGELILEKTSSLAGFYKVALDFHGKQLSSEEFSEFMKKHDNIVFIIGGPDGLAGEVLGGSDFVLSLSSMTLPHQLARVFLLEQVYRGFSILRGEKYHK
jgi:23S rRNA (pseudouridine1915-N3)-methyltransferase